MAHLKKVPRNKISIFGGFSKWGLESYDWFITIKCLKKGDLGETTRFQGFLQFMPCNVDALNILCDVHYYNIFQGFHTIHFTDFSKRLEPYVAMPKSAPQQPGFRPKRFQIENQDDL